MDPLLAPFGLPMGAFGVVRLVRDNFGFGGGYGHEAHPGGVSFNVCGVDNVLDLHGDVVDPDLTVFFSGNQFMMVPELVRAFQGIFPKYQRIYFETLPPGILEKQIRAGALVMGNLRIQLEPDVLTCGEPRIRRLNETEEWFDELTPYLRNRLVLMVREGNPKRVQSWQDLGRDDVRVSMPDPQIEGIGEEILKILVRIGGDGLVHRVMDQKVAKGTTSITQIHHRQTPLKILHDTADVGPAWLPEAALQKQIGNPIDMVELSGEANGMSVAVAAKFRDAPHPQAAKDFLVFLRSSEAQRIYGKFGFLPIRQEDQVPQA
jgi:ABC-type molybdate transport system substrate-binding protein